MDENRNNNFVQRAPRCQPQKMNFNNMHEVAGGYNVGDAPEHRPAPVPMMTKPAYYGSSRVHARPAQLSERVYYDQKTMRWYDPVDRRYLDPRMNRGV